ncbi:MAG: hypothetical protein HOG64_05810 [Flavobacteriaceae bacterium]|nr:hypothetical protein [Flavobacteriaceae bacterium]
MNWFVAYTKTRSEFKAQEFFCKNEVSSYVPAYTVRRQWSDRIKQVRVPAITGYIFIQLNRLNYPLINSNPFVRNVVKNEGVAIQIQNKEITVLKNALDKGIIKKEDFVYGDFVNIENGPFKNRKGTIESIEKNAIVVLLNRVRVKLSLCTSKLSLAS